MKRDDTQPILYGRAEERALIGSMFRLEPLRAAQIHASVPEKAFGDWVNQKLWHVIGALSARGVQCDPAAVLSEAQALIAEPDSVTLGAYLCDLWRDAPVGNHEYYAARVREMAAIRQLWAAGERIQKRCRERMPVGKLLPGIRAFLDQIDALVRVKEERPVIAGKIGKTA